MRHSRTVLVLLAILLSAAVAAQEIQGEMATEDYLLLLGQINPAARDTRNAIALPTKQNAAAHFRPCNCVGRWLPAVATPF
jgi:hypothetical protein